MPPLDPASNIFLNYPKEIMAAKQAPDIERRLGRGGAKSGAENYWHIITADGQAGRVFIKLVDEPPFGQHHNIQIFLNKAHQGQGIGSIAYKMACDASGHPKIYAHMRKSNIASRRAAEKAGFEALDLPGMRQLSLVWQK